MNLLRFAVPALLCTIGAMCVIANTWLVRAATNGTGTKSEAGYYERALAWDDHMETTATANRLGVSFSGELTRVGEHDALLCVEVRGADALPDAVSVGGSANLCPQKRIAMQLERFGSRYCGPILDACAGLWVFEAGARLEKSVTGIVRVELGVAR